MSGREGWSGIVIVTAIPEEFEAITRAVPSMQVVLTGDGPKRAAALSAFEEVSRSSLLIGAGICGAASPDLSPGDILVSSRILDDSGEAPAPSEDLVARACAAGARPATFVTVERPLFSSNEKRAAAERVAGGRSNSGAAAVDMESAGWAKAAAQRGLPFVILRSVADTLEDSLPAFLADCVDASGSIDRARVARMAAVRPWSVPQLLAMRTRVHDASARLGAFLVRFFAEGSARA